ncbi:MAG TPA: DUF3224 domain-containing protein [Gemmatimonadaceae bacterium]
MSHDLHAAGPFDVKLAPLAAYDTAPGTPLGRMSIDKQFHGELEAVSVGEMLMTRSAVQGSAGYVAIEHVTGTLKGRAGSFVLMHMGTMDRGAQGLVITVVPDSGTDELSGLSGSMKILIEGKAHAYEFDYTFRADR